MTSIFTKIKEERDLKNKTIALGLILGLFMSGCGGGGSGGVEEVFPHVKLAKRYISKNIILNLTNCTDPNDNGPFNVDDAIWTTSNQTGPEFDSTIILTKTLGGAELKTTTTASGNIDTNGNFSGTFSSVFTVDGVFDSSGDGTFDGTLKGDTATMNFVDNDKVGDTCIATGTIVFTKDEGQSPGNDFGSLNATGDVIADTGAVKFTTAINQQDSSFSWSNLEFTVTISKVLGTTSVKGKSGTAYACGCLPSIDLNGGTATFTNLKLNTSFPFGANANTKFLILNGSLTVPQAQ